MSILFYTSGTPWHIAAVALGIPSIVAFVCGLLIERAHTRERARQWLVLSLATNLLTLFYFKYSTFFINTVAGVFGFWSAATTIALRLEYRSSRSRR
jgi:hypothetical protein